MRKLKSLTLMAGAGALAIIAAACGNSPATTSASATVPSGLSVTSFDASFSAMAQGVSPPNFAPNAGIGWYAYNRQFIPPARGPGPVQQDPAHVYVVSNDGVPEELKDIASGVIDATVSQPADQYAKYGIWYAQQALAGKTFAPGPTDHNSNIVQIRAGVLEDQLSAPLVTKAAGDFGNGVTSIASTDTSLWGNNAG